MQLHDIKPKTPRKYSRQVGRGGKRGKTSGRGTKGQSARAGNKKRPELRDIIKKLPKRRGYGKNRAIATFPRPRAFPINVSVLEQFENGATVNPSALIAAGAVTARQAGKGGIKILATGELTKKLTLEGFTISTSAKEKIEKAGGSVK